MTSWRPRERPVRRPRTFSLPEIEEVHRRIPAVSPRSWEKKMDITSRRVYEEPQASDGVRVLVDRLGPRGLGCETARIDPWRWEEFPPP